MQRPALSGTVCMFFTLACLACGGLPDAPDPPAAPCPTALVAPRVDLVQLEGLTGTVEPALLVEVMENASRVDGEDVLTALQLELMEVQARASTEVVLLAVEPAVTGERLLNALDILRAVEISRVRFLARAPAACEPVVALELTLAQDGEAFAVEADAPWRDVALRWLPRSGEAAHWVLAGTEPTPPKRRRPRPRPRPVEVGEDEEVPSDEVGLSQAAVKRVLQSHLGAIRGCYQQAQLRRPSVSGRAVLQITVGDAGEVAAVRLSHDDLGDPVLSTCFLGVARRMAFPAPRPDDERVVAYPLVFSR